MNKFKSGDQVRYVNDGGSFYLKTGGVYTVERCDDEYVKLVDYGTDYYIHHFEPVVVNVPSGLPPEEVAKALLQGKNLEYYHQDQRTEECWHKVRNPKTVSISFMQSGVFRYAAETMDYYGVEIPKPLDQYPSDGSVYGISLTKHQVYKCSVRKRLGQLHFSTPEQAQEALTAILKPFGIVPQPLDENLVREQPR